VSRDSFVAVGPLAAGVRLDSATREAAVRRARQAALTHARGWVAAEPAAKNAHEALVDAYTAVQDFSAARAEMDRFRGTVPSYPELPFTEARVRFAAGEPERAAAELRRAVDSLSAKDFDSTSLSWVAVNTVSAGANVFAYLGDLDYATRVIDLANALQRRLMAVTHRPTSPRWATNMDWRMRGELYSAVGGPPGSLRRIWESAADAGRSVPAPDRASVVNSAGAAAVGLLASPVADTTAVVELARLSGQQPAREVRALLALSRGDTVEARRILAEPMTSIEESKGYVVFTRPLAAQAYYLLGDYASALRNLEDFDGGDFNGSQFDMRWGILPRARLLRAATYERIGRLDDARREYRQVLAQWKHADPALHPYLDQAGRGLVRLGEPPARLAALGYQLSANIADPKPGCSPPEAPGGRRGP
jgi:tetratricopeptide (TPR) repeat protein